MRRILGLCALLALAMQSSLALARDPIAEMGSVFKGQLAWVQEADEIGGVSLRVMNLDLQEQAARDTFRGKLKTAQEVLPIYELHVVHTGEQQFGKDGLLFLEDLPKLRKLSLGGSNIDHEDLQYLKHCKSLEHLYVSGRYEKSAMEALGNASSVQLIRAQHLRGAWASFPAFPKLWLLDAECSDLNNEGAKALVKSEKIACIYAYGAQLGDEGLLELAKLKHLKFLGVTKGIITDEGCKAFRKLRPDVEFLEDKPEPEPRKPARPQDPGELARS